MAVHNFPNTASATELPIMDVRLAQTLVSPGSDTQGQDNVSLILYVLSSARTASRLFEKQQVSN